MMRPLIVCIGISLALSLPTQAQQVLPDGTASTTVTRTNNDFTISGGTPSGSNLFHSFREFSIPTNGLAFFDNASTVQNIFSRVTGSNISNIDGIIRANGTANLFLLNPNGILFGSNARLNIGGSFLGTTAQSIQFSDGTEFSATTPTFPLLTMSAPIGLQMGQNPGAIVNQAKGAAGYQGYPVGLRVNRGQMLGLIGGDISIDGGGLQAIEGAIALGSVDANQRVVLTSRNTGWNFDYSTVSIFRDIVVQRAMLDVNGDGAGSIDAVGRNLLIQDGGRLMARNLANTTRNAQGAIQLQGSNSIEVKGGFPLPGSGCTIEFCNSIVSTTTLARGRGGDVFMSAPNIRLLDVGQIGLGNRGRGAGDSGKLTIQSKDMEVRGARLIFFSGIFSSVTNGASGVGGDIEITTERLRISEGGRITVASNSSFGSTRPGENLVATGSAGSLKINASDAIEIFGSALSSTGEVFLSGLRADVSSDARGAGGRIEITTNRLSVTDNATITTTTAAAQATSGAGNIEISARSVILKNGGSLEANSRSGSEGNIKITSDTVLLRSRSNIATASSGDSNGGNITINSPILIGLDNSNIIANAGKGRGGNINITTQSIVGLTFRDTLTPRIDPTSDITASSESNLNGTVQINNIGVDPNSGLIELANDLADSTQQITKGCVSNQGSSFVITGRGGTPVDPTKQSNHARPWADLRVLEASRSSNVAQPQAAPHPLTEATSWFRNPQTGKVELTAAKSAQLNLAETCAIASPDS